MRMCINRCCVVIVRTFAAVFGALIDYLFVGSCVCALVGYQRRYLPHIVLVKLMILKVLLNEAFLNEIVLFSILKQLGKMPQT